MKVLVTGSDGFIGSHLVERLKRAADEVISWDLKSGIDILNDNDKYEDIDVIYHLAARPMVQDSVKDPVGTYETNVLGTLKMLEIARANKATFVFASTAQVSGDIENPYALQKQQCEALIEYYHHAYNLYYTIYRIFNVFGPGEHGVIGAFKEQLQNDEPLKVKGGKQKRDFIYVDDVVNQLSGNRSPGTYELGSGVSISIQEIADMMSDSQAHFDQDKDEPFEMKAKEATETLSVKDYLS